MKLKCFLLFFVFVAVIGLSSITKAADIISADPTKVIINASTGEIIYMPREIDYSYALQKAALEAQVQVLMEDMRPKTLKEKILGKCNKKGDNK